MILPIGISFYTFEALSYVIDVYRGTTLPARALLDYAVFLTFFPRLVAGPIMRARQFLPQLERGITLTGANLLIGAQIFLQGMFKKLVIADNLALFVDTVYAAPDVYASATVWLAVFAYSIQIFCDFSGYTDMAIGLGRMLGIELPQNFNLPYTAQSFAEFWQRWHISLSTWLRDYLYIPLGGNRAGQWRINFNLMMTMLLGGLWHGASWNFVLWGGLHGIYLIFERMRRSDQRVSEWRSWGAWLKTGGVFIIVSLTWIFFRSPNVETTWAIWEKILLLNPNGLMWWYTHALVFVPTIFMGGLGMRLFSPNARFSALRNSYAIPLIILQSLVIYFFASLNVSPFIYFQF